MISKEHYIEIAQKYGHCASWAIWADSEDKPKSNIGDIRIFDLEYNPTILEYLNPNVIMVGLNLSRGELIRCLEIFTIAGQKRKIIRLDLLSRIQYFLVLI